MPTELSKSTWTDFKEKQKLDLDRKVDKSLLGALDSFDKTKETDHEDRLDKLDKLIQEIQDQLKALIKLKKQLAAAQHPSSRRLLPLIDPRLAP